MTTTMTKARPIFGGFGLLWRHQGILWWIFLVNLVLGWAASLGPRFLLGSVLNGSLHSRGLVDHFDLGVFVELLSKPEISLLPMIAGSAAFAILFFLFMLFLTGGIVSVYVEDRKHTWAEFLEACGDFFWRMVRLVLMGMVAFGVVAGIQGMMNAIITKAYENSPDEKGAFHWRLVAMAVSVVLFLIVRLWFDLVQTRTVRDRERGMFLLTFRTLGTMLRHHHRLFWNYFFITFSGVVVIWLLLRTWVDIPHARFGASWLHWELCILLSLAMRLWQRASMAIWYEGHAQAAALAAATAPAPEPMAVGATAAPAEPEEQRPPAPPTPPSAAP